MSNVFDILPNKYQNLKKKYEHLWHQLKVAITGFNVYT